MSVIDLATRKPLDDRIADAQVSGALEESDRAAIRIAIALAVHRQELRAYRFQIGEGFREDLTGQRCVLCDGLFPVRGSAFGLALPANLGGEVKPIHFFCFSEPDLWL